MIPTSNLLSLFVFLMFMLSRYSVSEAACNCSPVSDSTKICSSNVVGVFKIDGQVMPCPDDTTCWILRSEQVFKKKNDQDKDLSTIFIRAKHDDCGLSSKVPPMNSKVFIVGNVDTNHITIELNSCKNIIETVSGVDDPKVKEYRDIRSHCN